MPALASLKRAVRPTNRLHCPLHRRPSLELLQLRVGPVLRRLSGPRQAASGALPPAAGDTQAAGTWRNVPEARPAKAEAGGMGGWGTSSGGSMSWGGGAEAATGLPTAPGEKAWLAHPQPPYW